MSLLLFALLLSLGWILSARAEEGSFWTESKLVGTGGKALPIAGERLFPDLPLHKPTDLIRWPGLGPSRYLVTQLNGRVLSFEDRPDVAEMVPFHEAEPNRKLYTLAFDPGFPARPYCYLSSNLVDSSGVGTNRIARFTVTAMDPPAVDPATELILVEWASNGHNGCDLKFGHDGMLYASTGDGERPGDPDNVGQLTDDLLCSILRLDVSASSAEQPYRVPEDNPFVGLDGVRPEVWAYGLRNPWKMTIHPESGDLLLGDNGDEHWELVRHVTRGSNHGWSAYEGSHPFRPTNVLSGPNPELTLPAAEHSHQELRSVIGGLFYRGDQLPALRGHYLYGCYVMRTVWSFPWGPEGRSADPLQQAALTAQVVDFCEDADREVLVLGHEGSIHRLVAVEPSETLPIPSTLGATGLFTRVAALQPASGVLPYDVAADSWSDGATKVRHLALPPGEKIDARRGEDQEKSWLYPPGTAFAQTFFKEGRRVETQVMHKDGYLWRYLSYRWRDDQNEADLVPEEGLTDPSGRRFLSRSECAVCHTQRTFFTLAAGTRQLGSPESFREAGWFKPNRDPRPEQFPVFVDPEDRTQPIEARARSYLHVNCAHCHRETGLGGRAQFQLLQWLALEETGLLEAAPMIPLDSKQGVRILTPGQPHLSDLYRRMKAEGPGRMPLLGCDLVDEEGAEMIHEWIEMMKR